MSLTPYIVRSADGKCLRAGECQPADLALQAGLGETVAVATPACLHEAEARRRAIMTEARGFRALQVDPTDVLLEALGRRGVTLTRADLDAASATLQARRNGPEKGGKAAG
jgi:hypothetical protein